MVAPYYSSIPGGSYTLLYLETALNDGTGHFPTGESSYLAGGSSTYLNSVAHGDFDGDGLQDLAFSGSWFDIGAGGSFGGAYSGMDGTKLPGSEMLAYKVFEFASDLDGDGKDDIVSSTSFLKTEALLGGTTPVAINSIYGQVYATDFDGDGDVDVLTRPAPGDTFHLSLNDGAANFVTSTLTVPLTPLYATQLAFGDVDRDGDADLVLSNDPRVLRNARQQLSAPSNVLLGAALGFVVDAVDTSGPLDGFAVVALSLGVGDVELPGFGTLLINPSGTILLPTVTVAAGQGTKSLAIPVKPALVGTELFAQGLIGDTGGRVHLSNRTLTEIQ